MASQIGGTIGPRRRELFFQIVEAWTSTSADDREVIYGRAGNDKLMLLHPGFIGQDVYATIEDLQALENQALISGRMTSSMDCEITPNPGVIETLRSQIQEGETPGMAVRRIWAGVGGDS